jgi:hypothetical protein
MKITEISLSMSEIVPTGDYKNTRPHMSITWGVDEVQDYDKLFAQAQEEIKARFNAWLPSIINKAQHNQAKSEARSEAQQSGDTQPCPLHKKASGDPVAMKKRAGGFFSHARPLNGGWDYCNGSGWKSEKGGEA